MTEGDFAVSQDFSLSEQNTPVIAVGPRGTFAVVWVDYRNGNTDIFGRLYDSGGIPVGDDFRLNDDLSGAWQFEPDISSDWRRDYYVVWKDYRNQGYPSNPDVYYQRLDSLGFAGVNRNITTELPDSSRQSPAIGSMGWGKSVIVWADLRNRNWDVFAQSVNDQGNPLGPNRRVNDDNSTTPQHEPDIAVSSAGWFVVSWYDGRRGNEDIYIQKFDSSGTPVGANLRVNDDAGTSKQKFPAVAIGGNGVIYVVWTDWRNGAYPDNSDIYCQRFDSVLFRLGGNILINTDGRGTSQRDSKVGADLMGNACVVWSDSTGLDWNVSAQMIDYTGRLHGLNFPANLDLWGKQLFPDVALDGYFLYLTWADYRNGNYDIYARIMQYNRPMLVTDPGRIELALDKEGPNPQPITMAISNSGYGALDYTIAADQSWLTFSKSTGRTPDSFLVSIAADSLECGMRQGKIRLTDVTHGDSSVIIPVVVTITGPILRLMPDTLSFRALKEVGAPDPQTVAVTNEGTGSLAWHLSTPTPWVTFSHDSGSANETLDIGCDIESLLAGSYEGIVIIADTGALNSAETLHVSLEVETHLPFLAAEPDLIVREVLEGESLIDSLQIVNRGAGMSDWQAHTDAVWFSVLTNSGGDGDFVVYTVTGEVLAGQYNDNLLVEDTGAFNNPLVVPFRLTVCVSDTILTLPVTVEHGRAFSQPLFLYSHNPIDSGWLRFAADTAMLSIDSLRPASDIDTAIALTTLVDSTGDVFRVSFGPAPGRTVILPGRYYLGDICATADDSASGMTTLTMISDGSYLAVPDLGGRTPVWIAGDIEISSPTSADDQSGDALPAVFSLRQNHPNPFNNATTISFSLEKAGPAYMVIYNILGQRLAVLVDDYLQAGWHSAAWDGRDSGGRQMAGGIYFYKLISPGFSAVRKMIYLK